MQQTSASYYKSFTRIIQLITLSAVCLTLCGCARIAGNNNRAAVKVESEPLGAAIYVDNQRYGTTPAVITMPTYIYGVKSVRLKKEGYQEQSMGINS